MLLKLSDRPILVAHCRNVMVPSDFGPQVRWKFGSINVNFCKMIDKALKTIVFLNRWHSIFSKAESDFGYSYKMQPKT